MRGKGMQVLFSYTCMPASHIGKELDSARTQHLPLDSRHSHDRLRIVYTGCGGASGVSTSTSQMIPGVFGNNTANGDGVFGKATTGRGVVGVSESGTGIQGNSQEGRGVVCISDTKAGVEGQSHSHVGVWGITEAQSGAG